MKEPFLCMRDTVFFSLLIYSPLWGEFEELQECSLFSASLLGLLFLCQKILWDIHYEFFFLKMECCCNLRWFLVELIWSWSTAILFSSVKKGHDLLTQKALRTLFCSSDYFDTWFFDTWFIINESFQCCFVLSANAVPVSEHQSRRGRSLESSFSPVPTFGIQRPNYRWSQNCWEDC